MNFLEAVKLSLASLYAHKLRSALTLIGITIGVMTVIAVVSLIQGLNRYVSEDVIRLGTNVFMISKSLNVIISTDDQIQISSAIEEVREMLRRRRKVQADQEDDFSIFTQDLLVESWRRISGAMVIAMFIISSIGLLVGGVGVMNTMLVSVTERTQEIGVRRAVGARRINLVVQFLLEAIVLTCTGGALGILMGGGIAPLVGLMAGIPALLSLFWIVTAFSLSVVVGLVFGLYPAYRAARLNPVDALRCE